jgi:hypothetical protein
MGALTIAVLVIVVLTAVAAGTWIWWLQARHTRSSTVRIEEGAVIAGTVSIDIASIVRIEVAPMYDVAPADDLWTLRDDHETHLSFLGRDPGAEAVLGRLETELVGLDFDRALQTARRESLFEQGVAVWQR